MLSRVTVAGWLIACLAALPVRAELPADIRERGVLRVVTLNQPTSWYLGAHGPEGLEYELASQFAAAHKLKLEMWPASDAAALRDTLKAGLADIAAAQLTASANWEGTGLACKPYDEVVQHWVYRRGEPRPRTVADLAASRVIVAEDSPEAEMLERHAGDLGAELQWISIPRGAQLDPLDAVTDGVADVALIDAYRFVFERALHPDIAVAFSLPVRRPVAWIVRPGATNLRDAVDAFFAEKRRSGRLGTRIQRWMQTTASFRTVTAREFGKLIDTRLPALQPFFEQASVQTGVDWRFIAALAYQESQWNPRAQSPNGARGIMMLMPETARSLGVRNVFDPRENILAGARYFVEVRNKLPARIAEPDRSWFAVAAYNIGFGHLESARVVAQMRGRNPDRWADVRDSLPLLSDPVWSARLKTGYARGWEAAHTVDRVQQFFNVLAWRSTRAPAALSATPGSEHARRAAPRT
jgi:membrane-bound lytic murein transglycosylase F